MRTLLLVLTLALGAALPLSAFVQDAEQDAAPAYVADGRPAKLERWKELSCVECHAEIAEEWAETTHALAWVDPHYQEAIASKRRPQGCHGCHIPLPVHQGDMTRKPRARKADLEDFHFGVSCSTCHLGQEGEILGPWGIETDAHRSVKSPTFEDPGRDALCASCHQTSIGPVIGVARDFESGKGKSCVGCHMSVEFRSAAVGPDGTASEERLGRSHRLNGPRDPEFVARAFDVAAIGREGAVALVITNAAGHRVPGLTTRFFHFDARLLDASGAEVATGRHTISSRAHLGVDADVELVLDGAGTALEVTGWHEAPGVDEPVRFLFETLEVQSAD